MTSPAATAPPPRQAIISPKPAAPRPSWRWPTVGSSAHSAEPAAEYATVRTSCASITSLCRA